MGTAHVYLDHTLPVRVDNAHRVVYLADRSQHVLDEHDRPLFSSNPNANVVIVMEYAVNEDVDPRQVAPFVKPKLVGTPPKKKVEPTPPPVEEPTPEPVKQEEPELTAQDTQAYPSPYLNQQPLQQVPTENTGQLLVERVAQQQPPYNPASIPSQNPAQYRVRTLPEQPQASTNGTGDSTRQNFPFAPVGSQQSEPGQIQQTYEPERAQR